VKPLVVTYSVCPSAPVSISVMLNMVDASMACSLVPDFTTLKSNPTLVPDIKLIWPKPPEWPRPKAPLRE